MEEPDFWDNPEKSQETHEDAEEPEGRHRRSIIMLTEQYEEIELLIEMGYEENDPAVHAGDPGRCMDEFITEYREHPHEDPAVRRI